MKSNTRCDSRAFKKPKVDAKPLRTVVINPTFFKYDIGDMVSRLVKRYGRILVVQSEGYKAVLRKRIRPV
jgi:hypothetical protein